VDAWISARAHDLEKAQISLEYARSAMIRAHKKCAISHTYQVGDEVNISIQNVPLRAVSTQKPKLMPRYIGPLTIIEEVNPGGYRSQLPDAYDSMHDVFNESALRSWFQRQVSRTLDTDFPPVQAHPVLNPVVQVLDRKKCGRAPKNCHILDIPAQYLCVRKDGSSEWVPGRLLSEPEDLKLKEFEWRFPRSKKLPCDSGVSSEEIRR
jgi:hypothetical protein